MSTIENKRKAAIEILRQAGYSLQDAIEVTKLHEPIGLRDEFAKAAMPLVYPGKTHESDTVFANRAYEIADAMMDARKHTRDAAEPKSQGIDGYMWPKKGNT